MEALQSLHTSAHGHGLLRHQLLNQGILQGMAQWHLWQLPAMRQKAARDRAGCPWRGEFSEHRISSWGMQKKTSLINYILYPPKSQLGTKFLQRDSLVYLPTPANGRGSASEKRLQAACAEGLHMLLQAGEACILEAWRRRPKASSVP